MEKKVESWIDPLADEEAKPMPKEANGQLPVPKEANGQL